MKDEIQKDSIVKFKNIPHDNGGNRGGWFRVSVRFYDTVNLKNVFGNKLYHKKISIFDLEEDKDGFYEYWQTTEQYKCS